MTWAAIAALVGLFVAIRLAAGGAASSGIVWLQGTEELFVDWRTYLAAVECTSVGQDPYSTSSTCLFGSGGPFGGIPSNAPPYFHGALRLAGADASWGTAGGWAFLGAFFMAVALLPVSRTVWRLSLQGAALALVCWSPAGMLGFAKGNVEVFFVALGIFAASLATRGGRLAAVAPWLFAIPASVKYVPGVAIGVFMLVRSRTLVRSSVLALAALVVLAAATAGSLVPRLALTPKSTVNSFGSFIDATFLLGRSPPLGAVVALGFSVVALGVVGGLLLAKGCRDSQLPEVGLLVFAAVGGLTVTVAWAIFVNWEYRWLWTLLLLPLLTGGSLGKRIEGGSVALVLLLAVAPWVTRTDVARGPLTSVLTLSAVAGVAAAATLSLVFLMRLRRL
jgi:hypothetical protein